MGTIFLILYSCLAVALGIYAINCYVMIYLYLNGRAKHNKLCEDIDQKTSLQNIIWPQVTTQIAVYNEVNVIERAIDACIAIDYPKDKHCIQIIDDSNDSTVELIDKSIIKYQKLGYDVSVIRRNNRKGYKAGALANAHSKIKGDFLALFDADFFPPKDFLKELIPTFIAKYDIGLIQARWGHLNHNHSFLTRVQALGIDGHFMIEQAARSWNNLYMNFNGTAGIWRVKAIEDGGGWEHDTLTEDMDLSYRSQLKGWKTHYRPDIVVPAEIPQDINALKSQQFRWAKGSTQTALKLLPTIFKENGFNFKSIQAFLHMSHYCVHPIMVLLALLSLPLRIFHQNPLYDHIIFPFFIIFFISISAPNMLYMISQKFAYTNWLDKILYLPLLVIIGTGLAINNTKAVLEALFKKESAFIRTPKSGAIKLNQYKTKLSFLVCIEILLGLYCLYSLNLNLIETHFLFSPFIFVYAIAFISIALLSIQQKIKISTLPT